MEENQESLPNLIYEAGIILIHKLGKKNAENIKIWAKI